MLQAVVDDGVLWGAAAAEVDTMIAVMADLAKNESFISTGGIKQKKAKTVAEEMSGPAVKGDVG